MAKTDDQNITAKEELSIRDILAGLRYWRKYFASKWKLILVLILLCACLGLVYSFIKKPVYIAESTFVLEDEQGGLSQYAGLASAVGINLSGGSNGLFEGDNIIALYVSRTMLKKTLLTSVNFNGQPQLLIDRYIQTNKLRDKWAGKPVMANISFSADTGKLSVLQDSIIFDIAKTVKKTDLSVGKPDKKLSIIDVQFRSKDQLFAQAFTQTLVNNVNAFYIQTRSKHALQNVQILQRQTDSVKNTLNSSITGVATALDVIPDANPNRSVLRSASQKKTVDVQTAAAVYAELEKNLELAKIDLQRETPLIQMIDNPELPLEEDKPGKIFSTILGAILGFIFAAVYLVFRNVSGRL
jgi:hypothetical protein